ncbi:MAG TPA: hypothetical protein VGD37_24030 [Kofleriaceae bacterium]
MRTGKDLVLSHDVGAVSVGEPVGGIEQRLAGGWPGVPGQIARCRGDLGVHGDLRGVLGRQLGERPGELGPPGRQPREHRAFLVDEVPGRGAREVADGLVHAVEVAVVGAPGRKPAGRIEELGHHLVVAAVGSLELREAGQLHSAQGSTPGGAATSAGGR